MMMVTVARLLSTLPSLALKVKLSVWPMANHSVLLKDTEMANMKGFGSGKLSVILLLALM